jgi:hypothetical protein
MHTYSFTKKIKYGVLVDAINLKTTLGSLFVSYGYKESKEEDLSDNLTIVFNRVLLSHEEDEINDLINNLNDNHELVVRHGIRMNEVKNKMSFGKSFIDIFAANNVYRNKSSEQVAVMLQSYPSLIMCCLTGSIEALYSIVSNMLPDPNITEEELEDFKKIIEIFLDSNGE